MADEPNPSATSSDYDAQAGFWAKVNTILAGEAAIKAAAEKYLPKFANEKQSVYDARLKYTPFTNIYADISKNLASKPFAKEIVLKEGTPDLYVNIAENIDGQGNNHHVFCAQAFKSALDKAIDWIFVDYTKARPRADGKPLTRKDEQDQGLRPYWVHVPAERMLAVYSDFSGGVEIIHHARILERSKRIEKFAEVEVDRIRVLERDAVFGDDGNITGYGPARFELWEQTVGADKKPVWTIVEQGPITIGVIPLVPVVLTRRQGGSWICDGPIRDLADMQITEYRQESGLEWIKIMTCFPMVCVSGMETKDAQGNPIEVVVGPNTVFLIPQNQQGTGPAGVVEIVEPDAQSLVENRTQLELTRKEMRDLGMQPLTQAALTVVTTANVSKKASSAVQAWAFMFKDAIEQAWKFTAMWMGDTGFEPEVIVHTDFAIEMEQGKEMEALTKARDRKDISREAWVSEMQRRDVLSGDYDVEEDAELIAKEGEALEAEAEIDPVTGRAIVREQEPAAA